MERREIRGADWRYQSQAVGAWIPLYFIQVIGSGDKGIGIQGWLHPKSGNWSANKAKKREAK
jgi:hypothetical protein